MASATEHFDALAATLFGGLVRAADLKIMPGDNRQAGREQKAKALLESMGRVGIVANGELVSLGNH